MAYPVRGISTCTFVTGYVVMLAVIVACCFLYSLGTFRKFWGIFYITGYGALSVSYYLATTVFAYLNRRFVNKNAEKRKADYEGGNYEEGDLPPVSVHVVGYKEDPNYFRSCLESVLRLQYKNLKHIVVVVDGNDEDDRYMANIANGVFKENVISIDLDFIPSVKAQEAIAAGDVCPDGLGVVPGHSCTNSGSPPVYVVTQPHAGKREVIYTAYLLSKGWGIEFFVNTDSDTILDKNAVDELVYMVTGEDVNAVAGRLEIFNKTNWLTYLTAARYFIAFNIERASQGYHGVVGCISGPLGLYRVSAVRLVVEDWVSQTFWGNKCTFGDDRHMTNKLLSIGGKIMYTHKSFAETETPSSYARFVAQQTRWSKSYWRELFLQSGWATRHWYLMMETVYGVLFPVLIVATLLAAVFTRKWWSLLAILVVTFTMPLLRCLVVYVFFEHNALVLLGVFYPFMYFTTLLPVKFVALFTMGQNNWGTSSRKKIVNAYGPVVPVLVWVSVLAFGIVWRVAGF